MIVTEIIVIAAEVMASSNIPDYITSQSRMIELTMHLCLKCNKRFCGIGSMPVPGIKRLRKSSSLRLVRGLGAVSKVLRRFKGCDLLEDWEHYFSMYKVRVSIAGLLLTKPNSGLKDCPTQFSTKVWQLGAGTNICDFKQLQHRSTLEAYFNQFERYTEKIKIRMPLLSEGYFVESFVGGLQEDIKNIVRLFIPATV